MSRMLTINSRDFENEMARRVIVVGASDTLPVTLALSSARKSNMDILVVADDLETENRIIEYSKEMKMDNVIVTNSELLDDDSIKKLRNEDFFFSNIPKSQKSRKQNNSKKLIRKKKGKKTHRKK